MRRPRRILKVATLMLILLVSQGCVGFAVYHNKSTNIQQPFVADKADIHGVSKQSSSAATNHLMYTSSWLENHWGKPASVSIAANDPGAEIWTYRFGHSLYGAMPVLIVPIPLILPLGREKVLFCIRQDRVVSAERVEGDWSGAMAGLTNPEGRAFAESR